MTEYNEAFRGFTIAFEKMRQALSAWVLKNGGSFDDNGVLRGLKDGFLTSFQERNEQLMTIFNYASICDGTIKYLRGEIDKRDTEIKMLKILIREKETKDDDLKRKIEFLLHYEIGEDTTLEDFDGIIQDTVFYLKLALKREMIALNDPSVQNRLKAAEWFQEDKTAMKKYFKNKKDTLLQVGESVEKVFKNEQ